MVVIDRSFQQQAGTGETSTLMAHGRQSYSIGSRGVQDMFRFAACKRAETFGGFQHHTKAPLFRYVMFDIGHYGL